MNNKECIDVLNSILKRIGAEGICFKCIHSEIVLVIPKIQEHDFYYHGFGYWKTTDDMFISKSRVDDIKFVLGCMRKYKNNMNSKKNIRL